MEKKNVFLWLWRGWEIWDFLSWLGGTGLITSLTNALSTRINELSVGWQVVFIVSVTLVMLVIVSQIIRPLRNRRKVESVKTKVTLSKECNISAFYSTRKELGRIEEELANANKVYACWHGATEVTCTEEEYRKKVVRLLLADPEAKEVLSVYIDTGIKRGQILDVQSDILKATETFRSSGTSVKWYKGFSNLLTITDPDNYQKAKARIEVWLFDETNKRQNYVITHQQNEVAYNNILGTFEKMWNDKKWTRDPPSDLGDIRKKLGLGTQDSQT